MEKIKLEYLQYCDPSDNLFIATSNKKTDIGDQEYQDGVVLFRESKTKKLVGIEIIDFSKFKENKIQISKARALDLKVPFQIARNIIDCMNIIKENPQALKYFAELMEFKKSLSQLKEIYNKPLQIPKKYIPHRNIEPIYIHA